MDQVEEVEGADLQEALHLDHLEDHLVPRGVLQDHRLALEGLGAVEVLVVRGKHRKCPLGQSNTNNNHSSSSASRPSYGGGRYYGGGAAVPYRSGGRSPAGIIPFAIAGGLIFPGIWLYGAYQYNYYHDYNFRNRSNPNSRNESLPVTCLCDKYSACGCDDNNNSTFIDSIVGNGTEADQDKTLVRVANVNGTKTVVINGTLPNGTDSSSSDSSSTSGAIRTAVLENSGFWLLGAIVGATVFLL